MTSRLQNLGVIVTGSTTGIGLAIARQCVAEGARVLVHGRDAERASALVHDLGPAAVAHVDDLRDIMAPQRIVDAAVDAFGRVDVVINNAASVVRSDITTTTASLLDDVMAVNVRAPLLLIQAALPHLSRARGVVLNIGSLNGYAGEPNLLAYAASKGALMTISRNLGDALHRDHRVRVVHFNLGWVLTENEYRAKIADGLSADWPHHLPADVAPTGQIMRPEEIARMAAHWISPESAPVSGAVVDLEQHPVVGRNPPKTETSARVRGAS